jgi:hypothetical protein
LEAIATPKEKTMATTNIKVRSGNRTVVLLDGKQVGMIQSIRASDSYQMEAAGGIGDIHVQEYVPTVAQHSITVQQMVLYSGTLRQLGVSLENGDEALKGVVFDSSPWTKMARQSASTPAARLTLATWKSAPTKS